MTTLLQVQIKTSTQTLCDHFVDDDEYLFPVSKIRDGLAEIKKLIKVPQSCVVESGKITWAEEKRNGADLFDVLYSYDGNITFTLFSKKVDFPNNGIELSNSMLMRIADWFNTNGGN